MTLGTPDIGATQNLPAGKPEMQVTDIRVNRAVTQGALAWDKGVQNGGNEIPTTARIVYELI